MTSTKEKEYLENLLDKRVVVGLLNGVRLKGELADFDDSAVWICQRNNTTMVYKWSATSIHLETEEDANFVPLEQDRGMFNNRKKSL